MSAFYLDFSINDKNKTPFVKVKNWINSLIGIAGIIANILVFYKLQVKDMSLLIVKYQNH